MSNKSEEIWYSDLENQLKKYVVGQKIVKAETVPNVKESGFHSNNEVTIVTLSNGVVLEIENTSDCCAWANLSVEEIKDSNHIITDVKTGDVSEGYFDERNRWQEDYSATIFLLTDAGEAARMKQRWDESNGYYFVGYYLTVRLPEGQSLSKDLTKNVSTQVPKDPMTGRFSAEQTPVDVFVTGEGNNSMVTFGKEKTDSNEEVDTSAKSKIIKPMTLAQFMLTDEFRKQLLLAHQSWENPDLEYHNLEHGLETGLRAALTAAKYNLEEEQIAFLLAGIWHDANHTGQSITDEHPDSINIERALAAWREYGEPSFENFVDNLPENDVSWVNSLGFSLIPMLIRGTEWPHEEGTFIQSIMQNADLEQQNSQVWCDRVAKEQNFTPNEAGWIKPFLHDLDQLNHDLLNDEGRFAPF